MIPWFKKSKQVSVAKDLYNRPIKITHGEQTFIDPEVIIDEPERVSIGTDCIIRKGVVLRPEGGEIVIGDNCVINHYSTLHGKGGIYIGDWVIISPHCGFFAQNHTCSEFNLPITRQPNTGKGIYLMGDNWVGSHAVVLDDVTIGKGAVIGAHATLTKSIAMASIAAGTPARIIKKRYNGPWDFQKEERAALRGMPRDIEAHVQERARLLKQFICAEDSVLDVGCGEGVITSTLAEKNPAIIGCDYSPEALSQAQQNFPRITFVYSNATHLRFADESFTRVIFSDVAEHLLPQQCKKSLSEIQRVLQRGGKLIMATPLTGQKTNTSTYAHLYEYSADEMHTVLSELFYDVQLVDKTFGLFIA
ncbi:MAG: methyltransferase domain-containing protein, partial [Proteobacteria bacterium]|nr:methyltransferase domain-containing protein [Pseudomonadota bacterium]